MNDSKSDYRKFHSIKAHEKNRLPFPDPFVIQCGCHMQNTVVELPVRHCQTTGTINLEVTKLVIFVYFFFIQANLYCKQIFNDLTEFNLTTCNYSHWLRERSNVLFQGPRSIMSIEVTGKYVFL